LQLLVAPSLLVSIVPNNSDVCAVDRLLRMDLDFVLFGHEFDVAVFIVYGM
jgi:hypothetical protein